MSNNIKITIELTPGEYTPIEKMAAYCHCSPARIAEALLQGIAQDMLEREGDAIWQTVTEYLTKTEGYSERVEQIEEYMQACDDHNHLETVERRKASLRFGHLKTSRAS